MPNRPNKFFSIAMTALASAFALALVAPGCSDGTEGGGDDSCYDYASFNKTTPAVSFETDVLPIFRNSCGLSAACHGSQNGPAGQSYLGPPALDPAPDMAQIDAIFAQNVDVNAVKAPAMKLIVPGSPETSFLMHKMDNTFKCDAVTCDAAGCGGSMPLANPILSQAQRDTVRRWIAQGAEKN